ncbi:MAG: hypothetical protein ACXIUO_12995 [Erythrobacter sp.]
MELLHALAQAAGVAREWRDVEGRVQQVSDEALAAVLAALGHDTANECAIAARLAEIAARKRRLPAMLVADAGALIDLPIAITRAEATGADGITVKLVIEGARLRVPDAPGYYDLALDRHALRLAVAPPCCPLPAQNPRRPWGVSAQIPALKGSRASPFGTFGELAEAASALGAAGADALAINPVHALFPGNGVGYSPYSPSAACS